MKLIVERWVEEEDKEMEGKVEVIKEQKEVESEEEAKKIAEEWKKLEDTKKITLHYCRHDEGLPCERKVL
ncbi:MAG: hypothetical protein J7J22_04800 [Candidatus Verstraetearchaeota archaeon]|nr:hypothetical protein [Candidatus Verstraetearchaeota archaeon]